jgi:hypothetical protein
MVSASDSGSSSNAGGWGGCLGLPERVNALDFLRNSVRACMPSLDPSISGRDNVSDTFLRMFL